MSEITAVFHSDIKIPEAVNMKSFIKILKSFTALLTASVLVLGFSGCKEKQTVKTSFAMGSVLDIKILSSDEELCNGIFAKIIDAVNETDTALSATKDGAEIFKLNRQKKIKASPLLQDILQDTVMICNTLNRKVDLSIGNVTELWGFTSDEPAVPSEEELKTALSAVSAEKILIIPEQGTVTIDDDISIDMGAFGKGAACDRAFEYIRNEFTGSLIMTLGGTVMAVGEGPDDGKWTIGIRDPFKDADSYFATLKVSPFEPDNTVFISTSGSYEKTFTENGKTYHHILDPKTGYPVETDIVSVTVTAYSGLNADALSTFCFINGFNEDTLSTLGSFSAEAVFVFSDNTYYATDGLKNALTVTDNTFSARQLNEK